MLQTVIAGTIVAVAAAWVAWRLFVPASWKARRGGCGCARDPL